MFIVNVRDLKKQGSKMDVYSYNTSAWNSEVASGNPWTVPVDTETIERARKGEFKIQLTPTKFVPDFWLQSIKTFCV